MTAIKEHESHAQFQDHHEVINLTYSWELFLNFDLMSYIYQVLHQCQHLGEKELCKFKNKQKV